MHISIEAALFIQCVVRCALNGYNPVSSYSPISSYSSVNQHSSASKLSSVNASRNN
ncbi:hypothetical protein VCR26J2_170049 [Vibrio coralliirubri]|nr:hypothetical protein VCR26J2_170049 [Vibrio coralliirubri]